MIDFSKLNCKSCMDFDLIIFTGFVLLAIYVLYQYVCCQIQRLNVYQYFPCITSGNGIYNKENCPICLNEFKAPARTNCGHAFCMHCLLDYFQHNNYHWQCLCPLCRSWIRDFDCLYKYDFCKKEKAELKKLEKKLRKLIKYQNSQITVEERFTFSINKWKIVIGITVTLMAFIGAFIYKFFL